MWSQVSPFYLEPSCGIGRSCRLTPLQLLTVLTRRLNLAVHQLLEFFRVTTCPGELRVRHNPLLFEVPSPVLSIRSVDDFQVGECRSLRFCPTTRRLGRLEHPRGLSMLSRSSLRRPRLKTRPKPSVAQV